MSATTKAKTPEEFIAEQKASLASNPECGNSHYNLGTAYVAQGRFIEAEAAFHEALRCSPTLVEAYVQLGGLAMNKGDMDACLYFNEQASKIRPHFAVPHGNIGFVHLQRGDLKKAIAALKTAVKRDPNFVQALSTLASAYFMKGELDACIHQSEKALAIEPHFGPAYNNLALAMLEKGEYQKAMDNVKKAQESNYEVHPGLIKDIKEHLEKA
jgi:tetratricopeptide (TPR) repeat protein